MGWIGGERVKLIAIKDMVNTLLKTDSTSNVGRLFLTESLKSIIKLVKIY